MRKDVRPFLIEQACDAAFRLCGLVRCSSLLALQNLAVYNAAAGRHRHLIDCAVVRKRKSVNGLDRLCVGIFKFLPHVYACDEPADIDVDSGVFERAGAKLGAFLIDPKKRALCDRLAENSRIEQSYR